MDIGKQSVTHIALKIDATTIDVFTNYLLSEICFPTPSYLHLVRYSDDKIIHNHLYNIIDSYEKVRGT